MMACDISGVAQDCSNSITNAPVPLAGDATALTRHMKNDQIHSRIAKMVWWNISSATI